MGHMLGDWQLHAGLRTACAATPLISLFDADPVIAHAPHPGGVEVTLASGRRIAARMLVGADGRGSGTATRAGIRRVGWDYGQTALVCAVAHDRPHGGIAHQLFLPGGPFAILPLQGNRSSIVWSEQRALATRVAALDDDGFLEALRPRFGSFLGQIALAGPRFSYPLSLSLATDFIAPRVALVGDAAHGVHPIAGQGLNLGLRDVAALAEVLLLALRRGEDIGAPDVLARYQRWRRFDATALALGMDAVNRLFSNDNPALRLARGLGMGAITRMAPLRRAFMRQAAGLGEGKPRLLTGQPI
jgi:2-octaprenyl-6-methoxyphenol hydroxylase